MALEKEITLNHDIRGVFKTISEITDTTIMEDGVKLSSSRHRGGVIFPGSLVNDVYVATDTSGYSTDVQSLATTCWTPEIHTAYETQLTT